jgi:hypothetical protein
MPGGVVEPVEQAVGDVRKNIGDTRHSPRRPLALPPHGGTVEDRVIGQALVLQH